MNRSHQTAFLLSLLFKPEVHKGTLLSIHLINIYSFGSSYHLFIALLRYNWHWIIKYLKRILWWVDIRIRRSRSTCICVCGQIRSLLPATKELKLPKPSQVPALSRLSMDPRNCTQKVCFINMCKGYLYILFHQDLPKLSAPGSTKLVPIFAPSDHWLRLVSDLVRSFCNCKDIDKIITTFFQCLEVK